MTFQKAEFIKALIKDKRLFELLRKDPKTVYKRFGLELSDSQVRTVKTQFSSLSKKGMRSPEIIKELAAISFGAVGS